MQSPDAYLVAEINELKNKLLIAVEALEFYRDKHNFSLYDAVDMTDNWIGELTPCKISPIGAVAKKALDKIKSNKTEALTLAIINDANSCATCGRKFTPENINCGGDCLECMLEFET